MQEQAILDAFRTLQLSRDATLKEVRHAYRTLVRTWHPDRYAHDPRLQQAAQERLKEINAAYNVARKNIHAPPGVDSPFRFDLAAKSAVSITPAEQAGAAREDVKAEKRQQLQDVPSIGRPVLLNALFILLLMAAAVLALRRHGASPEAFIHFLLVVMIPGLCAFLCNSSLRTLQARRGYLAAIIIAGTFLFGEALIFRQPTQELTIGPDTGTPFPHAETPSSTGGSFGGEFTLGTTDRQLQPGLRQPSAPLSPAVPSVPAPALPDPPQAPRSR